MSGKNAVGDFKSGGGERDTRYDTDNQHRTLSSNHPISEFFRLQKDNLHQMTPEEFEAKFQAHMLSKRNETSSKESKSSVLSGPQLSSIVLKFTTLSENPAETPSFIVTTSGSRIGRNNNNEISVPSDTRLAEVAHATIEHSKGSFYLVDGGFDCSASVRIGVGGNRDQWALDVDARFSAGGSVFRCLGEDAAGNLLIEVLEGPLKGSRKVITKDGASIGRSSDNLLSIPDRELSRRHSRIEFDRKSGRYVVNDVGSTNGTYIQLVGPYHGRYKLNLNDHILVGRTGFSVNRYDYGLSEEMGYRASMEDACAIVQHLNIAPLNIQSLSPQSFFGVYDGHGGAQASMYLSQNLHVNVANALLVAASAIRETTAEDVVHEDLYPELNRTASSSAAMISSLDNVVLKCLKDSFLKTDSDFLKKTQIAQHGSTATTALILGNRLYAANVGDSRTLLCRNMQAFPLSIDHKPSREDEAIRIREAGGFIINNRVMGELAVSRAFGDAEFKKGIQSMIDEGVNELQPANTNWDQPLIIAEPEIQITTITPNDQFLLLACDGLFDVFTPEDVVRFVRVNMEEHNDAQRCCQNLTFEAIRKRNSRDNVSVILIILNKWY